MTYSVIKSLNMTIFYIL